MNTKACHRLRKALVSAGMIAVVVNLSLLSGSLQAAVMPSNLFCVSVGIDEYQDRSVGDLRGCVQDATRFINSITSSFTHATLLTNTTATCLAITQAFADSERHATDQFVLYIAGHGTFAFHDFYFYCVDTDRRNLLGTAIGFKQILGVLLDMCKKNVNVLVVLDTCQAGTAIYDIGEFTKLRNAAGITFLVGCAPDEKTNEGGTGGGFFTRQICEALDGKADENGDGNLTVNEVYYYAYWHTKTDVKEASQRKQEPSEQNPALFGTGFGHRFVLKYIPVKPTTNAFSP